MFHLKKRQADLLVALAETQNLHKASVQLHMTQPAASKVLSQLEQEVGYALFERSAMGTVPTAYGVLMIEYARQVLHATRRIQAELSQVQYQAQRTLAIGALPSATLSVVPDLLSALLAQVPDLQVNIEDGIIEPMLEKLSIGRLDIVIGRRTELIDLSGFERIILDYEPMVLVCGLQHPLAQTARLEAGQLHDCTWIFPQAGTYANAKLIELCDSFGLASPNIAIRSSTTMTNVIMLGRENLVAAMPQGIARYFERQHMLHILPLEKTVNFGEVLLFTNKRLAYSPNAALIDHACTLMQQKTAFSRVSPAQQEDTSQRSDPAH
ncbi:MAG TPA: LysR family transcriptional regulator [Advenella sp.]|nr:LysR family transcriptional regulator [Advenella sp.]